jgi:hypothetical protein
VHVCTRTCILSPPPHTHTYTHTHTHTAPICFRQT